MFQKVTQVIGFNIPDDIKELRQFMEDKDMTEWKMTQDTQCIYFKKESFFGYIVDKDAKEN